MIDSRTQVIPVSLTKVDWTTFVKASQDYLGFSPTRGLDMQGIKTDSPAAFLATLDFDNNPKKQLSSPSISFHHVSLGFIVVADAETIGSLRCETQLDMVTRPIKGNMVFALVTATIAEWRYILCYLLNNMNDEGMIFILNRVYEIMCTTEYRLMFSEYTKREIGDGLFKLRKV